MIKIVKQDNFEAMKERHNELMETSEHYKRAVETTSFEKGKKLALSIEITDEFFSRAVIDLLHGKIEGSDLLGFKVNEVVINPEGKAQDDVKHILNQVIMNLDQYKNSL
ncbi:hypothetical protein AAXE64_07835 [Priestia megaterium]